MVTLRAGFAYCNITPPLGLPLGGYGARVGGATGVLDPLACRVALFEHGRTTITVIALDLVHVFGEWVARLRTRLGDGDHVLVAATHTHSGPGAFRSAIEHDERLDDFEAELLVRVTNCVADARRRLQSVRLSFGRAAAPGIAANRRDPSLAIDDSVCVVAARAASGQLVGVIANFACHPTVLAAANYAYSGDLFGAAAADAARLLDAPVVLLNGAAGDVSTRFTRRAQSDDELRRLGHELAGAIAAAAHSATNVNAEPLAAASDRVPVRWRDLPSPEVAAAHVQSALTDLERVRSAGAEIGLLRVAQSRVEGAQMELFVASRGGWPALFGERPAVAEVQALRLGDVALVAAPGELFAAAGRWLREALGERTLVVGYANDYLGYFIPDDEARRGGYEALIAMVDPACEATIRERLLTVGRAAHR